MNTVIVVRPDCVWDTRSPMRKFVEHHKRENQIYWASVLALRVTHSNLQQKDRIEEILPFKSRHFEKILESYRKSFGNDEKTRIEPTARNLLETIHDGIHFVTEYALVSYVAEFDSFLQCWTLNLLLTKLERGFNLKNEELEVLNLFNPKSPHFKVPGFNELRKKIPEIKEILRRVPHVFTDPRTGKEIKSRITPLLNAYQTIFFWKDWRNLIVHSSGVVDTAFYSRFENYCKDFKSVYGHVPDVKLNEKLRTNEAVFRAVTTTHYLAALTLRKYLKDFSQDKRGHTLAPGRATKDGKIPPHLLPEKLPSMFLDGDHTPSYQYALQNRGKE